MHALPEDDDSLAARPESTGAATAHRRSAEQALVNARHNPVMSAEESFRTAEVHALLAIEERLGQLLDELHRTPATVAKPRARVRTT